MSEVRIFRGYIPKAWQQVVHDAITNTADDAGQIFVVKSPRQIGKSFLIEMELLRHAINNNNSINICVSITFSNCKKIFKELYDGIIDSGIIAKVDNMSMELHLINGSQIIFKSAQQRESLRGYTIKNGGILCIDEAAYIQDDVFSIIFPWTNVAHSNILMVSTPRIKQGTFYEYYEEGLNEDNDMIISFDLSKFDTSEMLSPEKVELYRKKMPRAQFITEILGEFSESGAGVFDLSKNVWINSPAPYDDLFVGIDWGTGTNNDYTVISGVNGKGEQCLIEMTNKLSPMMQIDWLVDIIKSLDKKKIVKIICEKNSIGAVYYDSLKTKLPNYPIYEFVTSNTSKREIVEYLIQRFEKEELKLINNKEQYIQFGAYAMEITSSGGITYNALPGAHDDCCMATAMAFKGIKDLSSAQYNISFGHREKNTRRKLYEKYN